MVVDYLSDPVLCRIPCYMLLHCTEVLSFNCGLNIAKYWLQLSAMKHKNIGISTKCLSTELYLNPIKLG